MLLSPFAGIADHVIRESAILKAFKDSNHTTYYVSCNLAYQDFCVNHAAQGLAYDSSPTQKMKCCIACRKNARIIRNSLVLDGNEEIQFENPFIDITLVDTLNKIDSENWKDFKLNEFSLGRMAFYEFALQNKINSLIIPDELMNEYKIHLSNVISAYNNAIRILTKIRPSVLLVYNSRYSVNNVFCKVAESLNIKYFTLNAAGNWDEYYEKFTFFSSEDEAFAISKSSEWSYFQNIPLRDSQITKVFDYLSSVIYPRNSWNYSVKSTYSDLQEIRKYFGIADNKKIIVVTLSSEDELIALEESEILKYRVSYTSDLAYRNLTEWLNAILEIARNNGDLFFIIRPHPRDFPGTRGGLNKSEQAKVLESYFSNTSFPDNFYINLPKENISVYDLMKISDLLLNQSSSVGAEFAAFGIPIIHNNPQMLFAYPRILGSNLVDFENYERQILQCLSQPKERNQIMAFRWLYFKFYRINYKVEDSDPKFVRRIKNSALRELTNKGKLFSLFLFLYYIFAKRVSSVKNQDFVQCVENSLKGTHSLAYLQHIKNNEFAPIQFNSLDEQVIPRLCLDFILNQGRLEY